MGVVPFPWLPRLLTRNFLHHSLRWWQLGHREGCVHKHDKCSTVYRARNQYDWLMVPQEICYYCRLVHQMIVSNLVQDIDLLFMHVGTRLSYFLAPTPVQVEMTGNKHKR